MLERTDSSRGANMTDKQQKQRPTVQINFRSDPDLKKRFEEAVYDHEIRTGRKRLTLNQVFVEFMADFIEQEQQHRPAPDPDRPGR
jgi:hypothetical protein